MFYTPRCIIPQAILSILLACAMLASGCTSRYGTQTTQVNHYSDCYAPINELRKNEFAVQKGVAAGAIGGALLGALIGYAATGKGSGAAAGAAVGGVAGGTAGGLYSSHQKDQSDAARLADYNARLDGNIREVDKATAAAKVARQCYERQFNAAAKEYKAGHITREQFNSRYREVVSGLEEAANILGETNRNSSEVVTAYNKAVEEEKRKQSAPASSTRTARSRSSRTTAASNKAEEEQQLSRMAERTSKMEKSVSAAEQEERMLRERLAATHKQAQDLMS